MNEPELFKDYVFSWMNIDQIDSRYNEWQKFSFKNTTHSINAKDECVAHGFACILSKQMKRKVEPIRNLP